MGLTAEEAKPPKRCKDDPVVWALWHSTQWMHVRVALGDRATVLYAMHSV